jgi:hypothetical protein
MNKLDREAEENNAQLGKITLFKPHSTIQGYTKNNKLVSHQKEKPGFIKGIGEDESNKNMKWCDSLPVNKWMESNYSNAINDNVNSESKRKLHQWSTLKNKRKKQKSELYIIPSVTAEQWKKMKKGEIPYDFKNHLSSFNFPPSQKQNESSDGINPSVKADEWSLSGIQINSNYSMSDYSSAIKYHEVKASSSKNLKPV